MTDEGSQEKTKPNHTLSMADSLDKNYEVHHCHTGAFFFVGGGYSRSILAAASVFFEKDCTISIVFCFSSFRLHHVLVF